MMDTSIPNFVPKTFSIFKFISLNLQMKLLPKKQNMSV